MGDIRTPTPKFALNLPTVGDFVYWYRFEDGADFPDSHKLYFLLGDPGTAQDKWEFTIAGGTASLKIESEVVGTIAAGTKYWLMYQDTTARPTVEMELQTGQVKKVNK